jgi:hypothetical protein
VPSHHLQGAYSLCLAKVINYLNNYLNNTTYKLPENGARAPEHVEAIII